MIGQQLLLSGKPTILKHAITDTSGIKYTLSFESSSQQLPESRKEMNVVTQKQGLWSYRKLQETLDRLSTHLEALELSLSKKEHNISNRGDIYIDRKPKRQLQTQQLQADLLALW